MPPAGPSRAGQPAATDLPGTTASARQDRLPWGRLLLLAAAVFAAVTTEVLPVGLLPQLSAALAVSEARIGWWVSAYAVVVALGAVPVTAVLARWPKRRALVVLLATYALSNAVIAVSGSFWLGLAARLLGGLAHAGLFSVVVATGVVLSPPQRVGRALAVLGAGSALALALGVPLGTALGAALGWRWAFVTVLLVLAALAVLTALVLPARTAAPGAPPARPGGRPPATASPQPSVLGALRGRALLLVAVTTAVLMLGHFSAYTYVAPLVLRAGVPAGAVSVVLLGYGLGGFVGLLLAGVLADRHPRAALRGAVALMAASLAALSLTAGSGAGTVVTVVVWGVAFGALPSLLQNTAVRSTSVTDAAPAVVNSTVNVGIAGGAWAGGLLLVGGRPVLLTTVAAALALVAFALTLLRPPAPR